MYTPSNSDKFEVVRVILDCITQPTEDVIDDEYELRKWAKSNFTYWARFLALYYGQKTNIPEYKDSNINAKLTALYLWTKTEEFQNIKSMIAQEKIRANEKSKVNHPAYDRNNKVKKQKNISQTTHSTIVEQSPKKEKIIYAPFQNINPKKLDSLTDKLIICTNCGGDGGASGQCFRCEGTGWQRIR